MNFRRLYLQHLLYDDTLYKYELIWLRVSVFISKQAYNADNKSVPGYILLTAASGLCLLEGLVEQLMRSRKCLLLNDSHSPELQ